MAVDSTGQISRLFLIRNAGSSIAGRLDNVFVNVLKKSTSIGLESLSTMTYALGPLSPIDEEFWHQNKHAFAAETVVVMAIDINQNDNFIGTPQPIAWLSNSVSNLNAHLTLLKSKISESCHFEVENASFCA